MVTTDRARTASPVPVVVLGEANLLSSAIARVLAAAGYCVVNADDSAAEPACAVLVEPIAANWRAVEAFDCPVVVLTSVEVEAEAVVDLVAAGATAVLPVESERAHLVATIERVLAGETALTRSQTGLLADGVRRRLGRSSDAEVALTRRELQILHTIEAGQSVKQTARELGISPRTVENTQRLLYRKLAVRNRAEAVAKAHALGLLTTETSRG